MILVTLNYLDQKNIWIFFSGLFAAILNYFKTETKKSTQEKSSICMHSMCILFDMSSGDTIRSTE
jgi:hypothetical protein